MADFEFFELTEDGSKTVLMSETGTILNKFTLSSTPSGVEIFKNNKSLFKNTKGMFLYIFEPDDVNKTIKFIEQKVFDIKSSSGASAFRDYINLMPSPRIAMILYCENTTSFPDVDNFFRSIRSNIWFTNYNNKIYNYVGLYKSDMKCIISENHGVNDSNVYIDIMFDKYDDIGLTGISDKTIDDDTEYQLSESQIKKYPNTNDVSVLLSTYRLKPNDYILTSFDIFSNKELFDSGGKCTVTIQFFKQNIWKWSDITQSTISDKYEHFEKYIKIPLDVDGFIVTVSKSNVAGVAGVKNMSMTKSTGTEIENKNRSLISTNGLVMNRGVEIDKNSGNPISILLNLSNNNGTVLSKDFKEYEY